jgi:4-amino-4-deoxy-L-arabinose transferase-like glycosyltransferase
VRRRLRAAWRAVPAPLAALLAVVLLVGAAWALLVPPFQAPDEQSHAGYVQSLAEGPRLPGAATRSIFSSEQLAAQEAVNSDQTAGNLLARTRWSTAAWHAWERQDARLPDGARSDGSGPNPASSNPPLFYLYDAVPYLAASHAGYFARLTAMRLAAVLWLLVLTTGAWLLAGELLARDRLLQLVAAAVAGLLPMVVFISAQIGPDGMLYALWSLVLWLGVRILRRGATLAQAVALTGLTGAAIVTKATSFALLPGVLLALAVALWRARDDRPRALRTGALAVATLALPVLAWALVAHAADHPVAAQVSSGPAGTGGAGSWGELLSYAWQFYLPRLPSMDPVNLTGGGFPAYHIWVMQGWGAFGWLEVRFPDPVYKAFAGITAVVAVAAVARLVHAWRRPAPRDAAVPLFLAAVVLALLAGLHWTDYHHVRSGAGPFMQGRYLFPLIALGGVAVAAALSWLRAGGRQLAAGAVLGGLVTLQLFSLGLVAVRFYA